MRTGLISCRRKHGRVSNGMIARMHRFTGRLLFAILALAMGWLAGPPPAAAQDGDQRPESRSERARTRKRARSNSAAGTDATKSEPRKERVRAKRRARTSRERKSQELEAPANNAETDFADVQEGTMGGSTSGGGSGLAKGDFSLDSHAASAPGREPSQAALGVTEYHCPMHPHVTYTKPSTCHLCGMELVASPGSASGSPKASAVEPSLSASREGMAMHGGRASGGLGAHLALSSLGVLPAQEAGDPNLLLGGSLGLDTSLFQRLRLGVSGFVRLPTAPLVTGQAAHEAQQPFLLGPFPQIQHFQSPAHDQSLMYPTVALELSVLPFSFDVAYTAKGDPAAELVYARNLGAGFMLHASIGGVVPVSTPSEQTQRKFAVNSMAGAMFGSGKTTAALMIHYGRAFYDQGSSAPDPHAGHDMSGHAMHALPLVDVGMLMLDARHLFFDFFGVDGGLMLMPTTNLGVAGASWMTQAYLAVELIPWKPVNVQLTCTASGMGADFPPPKDFVLSLGVSLATDWLFGGKR